VASGIYRDALGVQSFSGTLLAFALGASSTAGASVLELRLRHANHLISDKVCLLLAYIAGRVHL
jgi:hypothetical protein